MAVVSALPNPNPNPDPKQDAGRAGDRRARHERLLLAAVLLAVGLFGAWSRYAEYRLLDGEQGHLLEVQARAVDDQLSRELAGVEAALRGVGADFAGLPAAEVAERGPSRLRALREALQGVSSMQLLDREGRVLAAAGVEQPAALERARADLRDALTRPDADRRVLSPPFVDTSGTHSLSLSTAVRGGRGVVLGWVAATLEPSFFRPALKATRYAPDLWAAVAHGNGQALLVEPPLDRVVGINLDQPGSFFRRHRETGQPASVLTGVVRATGERRMMAHRTVQPASLGLDAPIVIAVGRSTDAIFAPWWRQTYTVVVLYVLLVAATSIALFAMQRRQRAIEGLKAQREDGERRAAERLALALRGADLGLWDLDVRSGDSVVSERWNAMLGLPHQAVYPGSAGWRDRVHPEDYERVRAATQAHLDGRSERFEAVYRMHHADGHWVWILDRGQVLERDPQGRPLRMVGTHMDMTERMQEHLALERSELSLSTTLLSIGDAVIATDPEGRVVRMDATAERLTGWTAAEAAGRPLSTVFRIVRAHDRGAATDPVQQVLAHGGVVSLANDTVLIGRDGSERQIADSAAPIRNPSGEITVVVLVFSDVTERYRAQQALQANEQRLRSLLDHLAAGVIVHGPDLRVVDANPAACRILGLTRDELVHSGAPAPHWEVIAEDGTRVAPGQLPVERVLANDGPVSDQVLGLQRPGDAPALWVQTSAYPVRDAERRIEQIVVTFLDITGRKRAEQRILEAQGELEATLGAVPDLLFDVDLAGRIHGFRSPRRDLLVMPPEAFIGRTVTEVLPAEAAAVVMGALQQAETSTCSSGREYCLELPDGPHWFELSVARRPPVEGQGSRFVTLARDISERRRAELARQALERQLREAQKIESIGTLAGGIAHDFNNILAAILGNVALAREDLPAGHPATASLEQINRAGLRARNLVQQILTFSRREQQGLKRQWLRPVVEETLELLRSTLPAGVRVDAVLPDEAVAVQADSTQLQQVLLNLCTNAWHALPEQGGRIEVGFERTRLESAQRQRVPELPPGPCVHLWVRDNGSGMDDATRLRIFDPLFTTKTVGRGAGLGLPVVHGIVRAHEGAIALDTAVGQGTTFHVYLPAPAVAPEPDAAPAPEAARRGTGQRVLYIDDDEVMVLMIQRLLERAGFQVEVDTDAARALERLRAQPTDFDVAVTDFNMPHLSGLDVAAEVTTVRPDLPVVIGSGYVNDELRAQAAAAGVRALMRKEQSHEDLARLLKELLAAGASA